MTVKTHSGGERLVEWSEKLLQGVDGHVIGLLATGQDVTQRVQAERALREREEIMRVIVSQAGDAIELVDLETFRFVEFNDAAFEMLGYTREEYAHKRVFDIQVGLTEQQVRSLAEQLELACRGDAVDIPGKLAAVVAELQVVFQRLDALDRET